MCLFPGSAEVDEELNSCSGPSSAFPQEHHATSDLLVLRVWQRVNQGKRVIGILVKNTSKTQVIRICERAL